MRKQRSFHQRFGQRAISTRKRSSAEAVSSAGSGRFGSKLPARRRARLRFNQLPGRAAFETDETKTVRTDGYDPDVDTRTEPP
jgi:hypothetical protein